jgi:hypothetical protein
LGVQWDNVHFIFRENQYIGSEIERGHRDSMMSLQTSSPSHPNPHFKEVKYEGKSKSKGTLKKGTYAVNI